MHLYLSLPLTIICLLAREQFVRSTPVPALAENHTKGRSLAPLLMVHAPAAPTFSTPTCTGEDLHRWISNNLNALRKALQAAVSKHGVEPTREIVLEILGLHGVADLNAPPVTHSSKQVADEVSVKDEAIDMNESESSSLDEEEVAEIAAVLSQAPHQLRPEFKEPMVSKYVCWPVYVSALCNVAACFTLH